MAEDMIEPRRVQLSRAKGWRMPENTVKVDRTNKIFGNPFRIQAARDAGFIIADHEANGFVADCFRDWLGPKRADRDWWQGPESDARRRAILKHLPALRGKNLACWCALDKRCHADILLELANPKAQGGTG